MPPRTRIGAAVLGVLTLTVASCSPAEHSHDTTQSPSAAASFHA